VFNTTLITIAVLKKKCKYWDLLHPVFADRVSSFPRFTADSLEDDDAVGDLLGVSEAGKEGPLDPDDDYNNDDDNPSSPERMSVRSESEPEREREVKKGKKPMRLEGPSGSQKKSKLSVADALMASNVAKEERARDSLDFAKRKWGEELKEKRQRRKMEEEEKRREHELAERKIGIEEARAKTEEAKAKTERVLAKVSLIKVLSDLGMSQEDVLEQVKDL
jgi:hypothetical protein